MEMNNFDEISNERETTIKCKVPKKVLHFSDGTLEEYSSDEEEDKTDNQVAPVDESTMTWAPWIAYKAYKAGSTFLAGCDYVGEGLAYAFGVTSPKYNYELEQFKKMQNEQTVTDGSQVKPETEMLSAENNEAQPSGNVEVPKY